MSKVLEHVVDKHKTMPTMRMQNEMQTGGEVGMRLIDADDLKAKIMVDAPDFMDGGSSITKAFIMAMLGSRAATPTIDAVQVVRCKDCTWWGTDGMCENSDSPCFQNGCTHGNWFCADGERK